MCNSGCKQQNRNGYFFYLSKLDAKSVPLPWISLAYKKYFRWTDQFRFRYSNGNNEFPFDDC